MGLNIVDLADPSKPKVFRQDNKSMVNIVVSAANRPAVGLGFADGTICVINTETGEQLLYVREKNRRIKRLLFVDEDRRLLSGDSEGFWFEQNLK